MFKLIVNVELCFCDTGLSSTVGLTTEAALHLRSALKLASVGILKNGEVLDRGCVQNYECQAFIAAGGGAV